MNVHGVTVRVDQEPPIADCPNDADDAPAGNGDAHRTDIAGRTLDATRTVARRAGATAASVTAATKRRVSRTDPEPSRPALLEDLPNTEPVEAEQLDALAVMCAQYLLADFVASRESDTERRSRMDRVLERQVEALGELGLRPVDAVSVIRTYADATDTETRIGFLIDCWFLDPFAPYSFRVAKGIRRRGIELLGNCLGTDPELPQRIGDAERSARGAHRKRSLGRIGYIGIGAAIAVGVVSLLAAPIAGAALGAAAGLSGAAAVSHGLALLGGGALAAGGAGMAGGMWVVAGAGAAAGLMAGGGGTALYELGSATARGELVKLQITFKVAVLDVNRDIAKAQAIIENLAHQLEDTRTRLDEERLLNEDNAKRVRELEATVVAIEETITWMDSELAAEPNDA